MRTEIVRCRKWSGLPIGSHDRRDGIASFNVRWQPEASLLIRARASPKGRVGSQLELFFGMGDTAAGEGKPDRINGKDTT